MISSMMAEAARYLLSSTVPTSSLVNVAVATMTTSFLVHRAVARPVTSLLFWGSTPLVYRAMCSLGISALDVFYQHPIVIPAAVLALWTTASATTGVVQYGCTAAIRAALALLRFGIITVPFAVLSQALKLIVGAVKFGCSICKRIIMLALTLIVAALKAAVYTTKTACNVPIAATKLVFGACTGLASIIVAIANAFKHLVGPVITNPVVVAGLSLPAIGAYAMKTQSFVSTPVVIEAPIPSPIVTALEIIPPMNAPMYEAPVIIIPVMNDDTSMPADPVADMMFHLKVTGVALGVALVASVALVVVNKTAALVANVSRNGFVQGFCTLLRAGAQKLLDTVVGPPTDDVGKKNEDSHYYYSHDGKEEEDIDADDDDEALLTYAVPVPAQRPIESQVRFRPYVPRGVNHLSGHKVTHQQHHQYQHQQATYASAAVEALPPSSRSSRNNVGSSSTRVGGAKSQAAAYAASSASTQRISTSGTRNVPSSAHLHRQLHTAYTVAATAVEALPPLPRSSRNNVGGAQVKAAATFAASSSSNPRIVSTPPNKPKPKTPRRNLHEARRLAKKSLEAEKKRDFDAMMNDQTSSDAAPYQPLTTKKRRFN